MTERRKMPRRTANIRRSIATLTLALLAIYCVDNVATSYLSKISSMLYGSLETRTLRVTVTGGYHHSGSEEYAEYYAQADEYIQEIMEAEKPEEFLAWLDDNSELYSYVEREVVSMQLTDAAIGQLAATVLTDDGGETLTVAEMKEAAEDYLIATSYDYAAIEPYLITEGCESLSGNEAIIAKYVTANKLGDYTMAAEKEAVFDGEQLVGQTISCTYRRSGYDGNVKEDVTYEIKIVGCYDNLAAGMSDRCELLMSAEELKSIQQMDESGEIYDEEGNIIPWDYIEDIEYNVVLKDYSMFTSFSEYVREEFGLSAASSATLASAHVWVLNGTSFVVNLILIVLVINSTLSLIYAIERDIRMRRLEFMLLKAMGYRDGDVNRILLRETLGMIGCAVGITAVLGNLVLAVVQAIVPSLLSIYYSNISFFPHANVIFLTLAVGVGAPLIGYLAGVEGLKRLESVRVVSE